MTKTPAKHACISDRIYRILRVLNGRAYSTRQLQYLIANFHQDVHNGYEIPRVSQIVALILKRGADKGHFNKSFYYRRGIKHNIYSDTLDYGPPPTPEEKEIGFRGFVQEGWLTAEEINNTPWKSAEDK